MEALSDVQREGLWVGKYWAPADVLWDRFVGLTTFIPSPLLTSTAPTYRTRLRSQCRVSENISEYLLALLNLFLPLSRPAWLAALILCLSEV